MSVCLFLVRAVAALIQHVIDRLDAKTPAAMLPQLFRLVHRLSLLIALADDSWIVAKVGQPFAADAATSQPPNNPRACLQSVPMLGLIIYAGIAAVTYVRHPPPLPVDVVIGALTVTAWCACACAYAVRRLRPAAPSGVRRAL